MRVYQDSARKKAEPIGNTHQKTYFKELANVVVGAEGGGMGRLSGKAGWNSQTQAEAAVHRCNSFFLSSALKAFQLIGSGLPSIPRIISFT